MPRDAESLDPRDAYARIFATNVLTDLGGSAEADIVCGGPAAPSSDGRCICADWADALGRGGGGEDEVRRAAACAAALNPLEQRPRFILDRIDP